MKQFLVGFSLASLIWVGILYAQSVGMMSVFEPAEEESGDTLLAETEESETGGSLKESGKRKRRGGKSRRGRFSNPTYDTGSGTSGDALGAPGARNLAMGSRDGEEQLSSADIERGIDGVWRGVERCLVLIPTSAPATGKVVAGMHIASSGRVTKVNLKGPNVIIQGEAGACIRKTIKSINYPGFDGPDMVVNYPMFFD